MRPDFPPGTWLTFDQARKRLERIRRDWAKPMLPGRSPVTIAEHVLMNARYGDGPECYNFGIVVCIEGQAPKGPFVHAGDLARWLKVVRKRSKPPYLTRQAWALLQRRKYPWAKYQCAKLIKRKCLWAAAIELKTLERYMR